MVSMADFTVKVEVATGDTPRTASPTYTDLSAYVRAAAGITPRRGRSNEYDAQAQPGRGSGEFRNSDGRFTVGNGSSPYAPVQIRRPCRVRVTYAATTYPLWAGFIDSWGNGREELTGVARVEASDRLARAGQQQQAAVAAQILVDGPVLLFPLTEPEFSTSAGDITGAPVASMAQAQVGSGGSLDFGSGAAPGPDDGAVAAFTRSSATNGKRLASPASTEYQGRLNGSTVGNTVEAFLRPSSASIQMTAVSGWFGAETFCYFTLGVSSTGKARLALSDGAGTSATLTGTTTLPTTSWTHVAYTQSAPSGGSVTVRLYVNGVQEATTTITRDFAIGFHNLAIGGASSEMWDGQVSHVAVFLGPLTAGQLLEHAGAVTSWSGETSDVRFDRLCANAGLSSTAYSASGGSALMGPQATKGRPLLASLAEVAGSELGAVFVDSAGVLTLGSRAARYNAAVALTLDATKPGQVPEGFTLDTDDGLLVNDYTVERPEGATQRVVDTASVDAYDTQADSATMHVDSDDQARTAAEWRVYTGSSPQPRASQLTVDAVAFANSGGTVANLLGIEIGDRVQVTNLPSDVAASSTIDLFVEGVAWRIDKERITATLTVSPMGAAGAVFVFDDATYGKFDTGGVIAA